MTVSGPFQMGRGFINGTQMTKDKYMGQCDKIIFEQFIVEVELV